MECTAEGAGPVLAHLSLIQLASEARLGARPAPPEVGGGSLTRIPPGLGMLGQRLLGMLGQGSWDASGRSLGDVLGGLF